jgi:hypothetical protein
MSEQLDNLLEHLDDIDLDKMLADEIEAEADLEAEVNSVPDSTPKLDKDYAGYMELAGAKKDGDCKIVFVDGGISKDLGCCNLYHPVDGAKKFNCGQCKYED